MHYGVDLDVYDRFRPIQDKSRKMLMGQVCN